MLTQLHIQNYAIIKEIKVEFTQGLTIITGETGAGKSILVGALGLILGDRADVNVLMDKNKKCFIEGVFMDRQPAIKTFLELYDLDISDEIVIRREISPGGKSRAFINDSPVTLNQLKELSSLLVDLHQQFDTAELGDNNFQREVIDALANNNADLMKYGKIYKSYIGFKKQLEEWKDLQKMANKEFDYNSFVFKELEEAGFTENELEEIESNLKLMNHAELVKATIGKVYSELQESDQPLIQQIKSMVNQLQNISDFHTGINVLVDRLKSTQVELQDIADEIDRLESSVQFDSEKIQLMNDRLSTGYKLMKKHGVQTTNQLIEVKMELSGKLETITNLELQIAQKEIEVRETHQEASKIANQVSTNRKKQFKPFEDKVNLLLARVGMPNAQIRVSLQANTSLGPYGIDTLEFLFDANKSDRFEPLRKVASGGELSRLMLIIKSLVAKSIQLPTLIFDEIDSGISGEAARQVGIIMKELSEEHQLISITHQPQIAARASTHYFVFKQIESDRIITSIKRLNDEERIVNIATMLSGEKPTLAAFANAREMIGN